MAYTVSVNHGEFTDGAFSTEEEAWKELKEQLSEYVEWDEINESEEDGSLVDLADGYGFHVENFSISVPDSIELNREMTLEEAVDWFKIMLTTMEEEGESTKKAAYKAAYDALFEKRQERIKEMKTKRK